MSQAAVSSFRDKQRVAESFSRSAGSYDSVAQLQRDIGNDLLQLLPDQASGTVIDLGSGTGYFSSLLRAKYSEAHLLSLDLAEGMLGFAKQNRPLSNANWLCADAENLPLAAQSVELIFSSLMIQWCQQPERLFCEINRVLKPGGTAYIATLGPNTLCELRNAWASVDSEVHVNEFIAAELLTASLPDGLQLSRFTDQPWVLQYRELKELTAELKGIGAHNMNPGQPGGLTGRQRILAFKRAYEAYRDTETQMIPATYQVYYLTLTKPL